MAWGAIAGAAIGVVGGAMNNKKNREAQKDLVETPTRTSEISQALENAFSSQDTSSVTSVMEEIFGSEFTNAMRNATESQTTEQVTARGDEGSRAALDALIGDLGTDTDARMQTAIDAVLRSGMPAVSNVGARAGTFGDTTTALLQNDLIARAAAAGLGAEDAQRQQLIDAITAAQAGTETTTGQADTSQQSSEQAQTDTSQTRDATEGTDTTTTTESSTERTDISDAFTNPGARTPGVNTDLGELISTGKPIAVNLGLPTEANKAAEAVAGLPSWGTEFGNPTLPSKPGKDEVATLAAIVNDPNVGLDDEGNLTVIGKTDRSKM